MNRMAFILLSLYIFMNPAHAQSWGERQQMYNEKANLETQLFQQREEIERIKQEHERSMEEQRRELEMQMLGFQEREMTAKNNYSAATSADASENLRRQKDDAETKVFVEEELKTTDIVFYDDAATPLYHALTKMDLRSDDISRVMYARKAMYLRIENGALQGKAKDQRKLAIAYFEGDAIKQSYDEALKWFKSAAGKGDAEAQTYLGRFYSEGILVSKNEKIAADWYMKAAQQNYTEAQFIVGSFYSLGMGLPQSDEKSYDWFRKAADRGYGNAQYVLGLRYHDGSRIPKDDVEAAFWFRLAALNKADYFKDAKNFALTASVIGQLLPEDRAEVERRVTQWEPIRTKDDQVEFDRLIADQHNFVMARLAAFGFSDAQASSIFGAYMGYLFPAGKIRSIEASQMKAFFERVEGKLDKLGKAANQYEVTTQQLISELSE